jgi:predicted dehydrogenase
VKPRLGFLGVGWIGRNRLEALVRSDVAEVAAIADPVPENAQAACRLIPCPVLDSLDELLDAELDGLVIATPSALHADQATAALERGVAVFCQKPLGRTADETTRVVRAARSSDRLLAVDFSYRFIEGARQIRELIRTGSLGKVYNADLLFHNAYGPDKSWFYDPALSGGGCVIDLGIHLVDLALWSLDQGPVIRASSRLFMKGEPLGARTDVVEDFATAELELESGALVRLACSWRLPAGRDAVIQASFFGTDGGARLSNVDGSFYDFTAELFRGTSRRLLSAPPDDWGGRALVEWARQLAIGSGFDPAAGRIVEVAAVVDAIYGRGDSMERGTVPAERARLAAGVA